MPHDFMPGLAGVPAAKSSISDVDGQRGILEYRGIRIEEPECVKKSFPTYWDELERFRCHHQANAA